MKKEKEINDKITFLKDKENLIDNENQKIQENKLLLQKISNENKILKKEIEDLKNKNKELEEVKELKLKSNSPPKILPLSLYKEPTLIGLNNIGATCFMNSTLQCLSQTNVLTNYFLNRNNKNRIINNNIALNNKNEYQLSPVYLELIEKLWNKDEKKSYSPNNFMNRINNMNPLFNTGQAGDSKDFIIYVLEQLHKELKKPVNLKDYNNLNKKNALNQYYKNNAFDHFFNEFQQDSSIISDIFFGFTETTNECLNCKNIFNSKGLNNPNLL